MADKSIRIRENDRFIARGCWRNTGIGRYVFQCNEDETIVATIDYTDILAGSTISTATLSADGLTASRAIASGVITLTMSAVTSTGDLDMTVTFADGRVRQEHLRCVNPFGTDMGDYQPSRIT